MSATTQAPPGKLAPGNVLSLDAFVRLLRPSSTAMDAYLTQTDTSLKLSNTLTTVHCYHFRHDGNKYPRVNDLCTRLLESIVDYAIPRSEIAAALSKANIDKSASHFLKLYVKAHHLFTDIVNTGEGGELLLYLLTETYLRLPQVMCKMPLKTSSQMHFHGADGIHGTVNPTNGVLALYWGESKLYSTLSAAISACLESLAPFVIAQGGSRAPQRRDLELLSDNLDLDDPQLEAAFLRYLDPDDVNHLKLEYRGVALVGFDGAAYATHKLPCEESEVSNTIKTSITSWHKSIRGQLMSRGLKSIEIELFCVPFPSVEAFRDAFLKELALR